MAMYLSRTRNDVQGFKIKVKLRIENLPEKKTIKVLDAFAGDGLIWKEIKKQCPDKVFEIVSIDNKKGLNNDNIVSNNVYYILRNDISNFDVIDLDCYGSPFEQLRAIFYNKKVNAIIFFTLIRSGLGATKKDMLAEIYGIEIGNRISRVFSKNPIEPFCDYIRRHGITKINYTSVQKTGSNKFYGYFNIINI
jgi:hypothetical protein